MEISLKNAKLAVKINSLGAELCSVKAVQNELEFMWGANPKVWGRHAPVLFPIVGQLKRDSYIFNGKHFSMSRHGFARDREFELVESSEGHARFRLSSDEQSLQEYPFHFYLYIDYQLFDNRLQISYEVENRGSEPMPFSIGGHPAFACPIGSEAGFKDHYLQFEHAEAAASHNLKDGLLSGKQRPLLQHADRLQLSPALFENDALIFKNLQSTWVELRSEKHPHFVRLSFEGFPYLGIWAKPKAPFICLEPWLGLADSLDASGYLLDKEGMQIAMPHRSFHCTYSLIFG